MKRRQQKNMEFWLIFSYLLPISILFLGVSILISAIAWLKNNRIASEIHKNTAELERGRDALERAVNELKNDSTALHKGNTELKEEVQKLHTALKHMCWWLPRR